MLDRRQAVRQLLNVLWPNRCPGCDCFLTANEMVCPACAEDMLLDHDACCHVCGKVACRCKEARFAYDRAVVSFAYAGATIPAVYRLKDSQNTNFSHFAAEILAERVKISPIYGVGGAPGPALPGRCPLSGQARCRPASAQKCR